ncbi:WhiB family transcriptional regulator [Kocuria palustris]|uniref:WhiB family transcriptional regulator n=1 Tax=Kocuria palustris TaxID=71999 RepID=UPI00164243DF|nr:WhiB family transcriptional regulator [Kocuria palustris]
MSATHDRLLATLEQYHPTQIPCRGPDGDRWITGAPADIWYAQAHCEKCPARVACASYAVDAEEPAGVWGGTTPKARAGLARQRRRSEITAKEAAA